jgi:hypothetical protein
METRNGKIFYVTGVTIVINRLNIRNMFVADKVVTRISGEHDPTAAPESSVITTGSHFENLRIAGHPVTVEMDHKTFVDCPTHAHFHAAWKKDKKTIVSRLMGSTLKSPPKAGDPLHLREIYQGFDQQRKAADLKETVLCSFVQKVNGIEGAEIDNWGPIIRIPQFGTLYLGEVICCTGHRRVNMFRLQLGSPDCAGITGGGGGGNGGSYPG